VCVSLDSIAGGHVTVYRYPLETSGAKKNRNMWRKRPSSKEKRLVAVSVRDIGWQLRIESMSLAVQIREAPSGLEHPPITPLNEAVWDAWKAKGLAEDRRSSVARLTALKWVSISVLFAAAGLGPQMLAAYDVAVRFIVATAATVLLFNAFQAKRYTYAAVFAALVVLYNPIVPVFDFIRGWQRVALLLSTLPILASLAWLGARTTR
jgi:hypothetical protein